MIVIIAQAFMTAGTAQSLAEVSGGCQARGGVIVVSEDRFYTPPPPKGSRRCRLFLEKHSHKRSSDAES